MIKFIRSFPQRLIFIYVVLLAVFIFLLNGRTIIYKVQLQTLNRIKPESFQPLRDSIEKQSVIDTRKLQDYIFYYERVARYVQPLSGDIFGALGYCYYLSGDVDRADNSFKQAMKLSPEYFWYPYNLGILALQKRNSDAALKYFQLAEKADSEKTLLSIVSSIQIYMPLIFNRNEEPVPWLAERLAEGFHQKNVLLLYSEAFSRINQSQDSAEKKEADELIRKNLSSIRIQIF